MDEEGFRTMLEGRKVPIEKIPPAIDLCRRFETFLTKKQATAEDAWSFSELLIQEGNNTYENYVTLVRYSRLTQSNEMFVAFMELVDGGEVGENLYRMIGERFGAQIQGKIYKDHNIAPYGLPTPRKPETIHPVIKELELEIGKTACREFLSACLRDLPNRYFLGERRKYLRAGSVDTWLEKRHDSFLRWLKTCQRKGELFFVQEITPEVLDFVKNNPEIGGGRREGNIIYETKIPYMTKQYLREKDPIMKRYYACHCPWVREGIRQQDTGLMADFCYCSAGFHKKPFEVVFRKPLKVNVLETVLGGDTKCRFAIHLPEEGGGE